MGKEGEEVKRKFVVGLLISSFLLASPYSALASPGYSLEGSLPKSCQVGSEAYLTIGAKNGDVFLKQQSFEVTYKYQDKQTKLTVSNQDADQVKVPIKDDKPEIVVVNVSWQDPNGEAEQWSSSCEFVKNVTQDNLSPGAEGYVQGDNLSQAEQLQKQMEEAKAKIKTPLITPTEITPPYMPPTRIITEDTPVNFDLTIPKEYSDNADVQLSSNSVGGTSNYIFTFKAKKDVPPLKDVYGFFLDTGGAGEFQYKVGDKVTYSLNGVEMQGQISEVTPYTIGIKLDSSFDMLPDSEVTISLSAINQQTNLYHADMQYVMVDYKTSYSRTLDIMLTAPVESGGVVRKPIYLESWFRWSLSILSILVMIGVVFIFVKRRKR